MRYVCDIWMQCFIFLRDVRKNCDQFQWCYLWYENSMRWPPPLVAAAAYIKSPCSEMLAFKPHVNVTYFHLKGTTRRRSGHASLPHNVEPQVHGAENRLCRIWCLHGWACEQPSWPFSVFIPPIASAGPLANQRVGNLQVSATTSKERWQSGRGKGDDPPRGAGAIWQLKWDMRFPGEG